MIRATFAGFTTALSALQSNQKRLDVTGNNLANMHTTGYTRQALQTSSLNYTGPISHYMNGSEIQVGFGVSMDRVTQIRDPFLDSQYRTQMEKSGYTDAMQTSLDTLSRFLDETSIQGIRGAFDDIQSCLTNAHDPAKVNDPVFESELRARMENLTNLLNQSAQKINDARTQEFQRLDGDGTNQNGAEQTINDILTRIGELNRQIKHNQVFNQQSLELMDERNVLLDELSGYVPIEVSYFKDADHQGDKDWPDDLKVDLLYYKTENGVTTQERLTLVNGTEGVADQNVGSLMITNQDGSEAVFPGSDPYLNVRAQFTEAASAGSDTVSIAGSDDSAGVNELGGGSIQAGLDMLSGVKTSASAAAIENTEIHNYQYYMNQLDNLSKAFGSVVDTINNLSAPGGNQAGDLIINYTSASTIGVNPEWAKQTVSLGKGIASEGNNSNDTALALLRAMQVAYGGGAGSPEYGADLGGKTFADYMNHVSTVLATDSSRNQNLLKTNVTILNGLQDSRDSLSGISLDEEAANMMTYMASYNAASRLMTTLDEALNTLINNTGLVGR